MRNINYDELSQFSYHHVSVLDMSKKRKLLQTNNECTKTETNNENSDKLTSVLSQSTESGECFQWCEASGSVECSYTVHWIHDAT